MKHTKMRLTLLKLTAFLFIKKPDYLNVIRVCTPSILVVTLSWAADIFTI